jgi:hypothetical protein
MRLGLLLKYTNTIAYRGEHIQSCFLYAKDWICSSHDPLDKNEGGLAHTRLPFPFPLARRVAWIRKERNTSECTMPASSNLEGQSDTCSFTG